jgi:predicted RNA-binding Zn ribbon-like protein
MTNATEPLPEPRPDELFVTFANTLVYERGAPVDLVAEPGALLDWLHANGLLGERARATEAQRLHRDPLEAERRLERFRYLRDLLHAIAERVSAGSRPTREQVRQLNHVLRHGLHYHRLLAEGDGTRYSVAQVGDHLDQARATIASSLANFLAQEDPYRLRTCANDGCREVFVDRSPTGRRRWCNMAICGNRAKVARHRAREKRRVRRTTANAAPASFAAGHPEAYDPSSSRLE